jgi:hypothetical protein
MGYKGHITLPIVIIMKLARVSKDTYRPIPKNVAVYEKLFRSGRGQNNVMKRLKAIWYSLYLFCPETLNQVEEHSRTIIFIKFQPSIPEYDTCGVRGYIGRIELSCCRIRKR